MFIGSSSEAKRVASYLKDGLDHSGDCGEVTVWTQGVFGVSEYVLDGLEQQASAADFAVLVVTARRCRRQSRYSLSGAAVTTLSSKLAYSWAPSAGDAPSSWWKDDFGCRRTSLGLTWVPYTSPAERQLLGRDEQPGPPDHREDQETGSPWASVDEAEPLPEVTHRIAMEADDRAKVLAAELGLLCSNADAQGWSVKDELSNHCAPRQPTRSPPHAEPAS